MRGLASLLADEKSQSFEVACLEVFAIQTNAYVSACTDVDDTRNEDDILQAQKDRIHEKRYSNANQYAE